MILKKNGGGDHIWNLTNATVSVGVADGVWYLMSTFSCLSLGILWFQPLPSCAFEFHKQWMVIVICHELHSYKLLGGHRKTHHCMFCC